MTEQLLTRLPPAPACRPERVAEQKQEMVARGEGAQQLEPNLVGLASR